MNFWYRFKGSDYGLTFSMIGLTIMLTTIYIATVNILGLLTIHIFPLLEEYGSIVLILYCVIMWYPHTILSKKVHHILINKNINNLRWEKEEIKNNVLEKYPHLKEYLKYDKNKDIQYVLNYVNFFDKMSFFVIINGNIRLVDMDLNEYNIWMRTKKLNKIMKNVHK